MPTTERSLASTTVSQPAARIRSPPTPKNSSCGSRRSSVSMSCAPYISPEASPAEIRIRKTALYRVLRACLVVPSGSDFRLREASRIRGRGCPRHIDFLVFVLELIQLEVNPALGQELLVGAHFADLAFVHNDDFVGALHG